MKHWESPEEGSYSKKPFARPVSPHFAVPGFGTAIKGMRDVYPTRPAVKGAGD